MPNRFPPCMIELHKLAAHHDDNNGLVAVMLELFRQHAELLTDMNVMPFDVKRRKLNPRLMERI